MKPNYNDEQFKPWFRELRRADERAAPAFDQTWSGARSRSNANRRSAVYGRMAVAVIALVAVGMTGRFMESFDLQHWARIGTLNRGSRGDSAPTRAAIRMSRVTSAATKGRFMESLDRAPAFSSDFIWPSAALIYRWPSPTDFLLTSAGDQRALNFPSLTESSAERQVKLPAQTN